MSEELEKLRHKQYVAKRKLTAAKHKEKRLQSELKRQTRFERENRCRRKMYLEIIYLRALYLRKLPILRRTHLRKNSM